MFFFFVVTSFPEGSEKLRCLVDACIQYKKQYFRQSAMNAPLNMFTVIKLVSIYTLWDLTSH